MNLNIDHDLKINYWKYNITGPGVDLSLNTATVILKDNTLSYKLNNKSYISNMFKVSNVNNDIYPSIATNVNKNLFTDTNTIEDKLYYWSINQIKDKHFSLAARDVDELKVSAKKANRRVFNIERFEFDDFSSIEKESSKIVIGSQKIESKNG